MKQKNIVGYLAIFCISVLVLTGCKVESKPVLNRYEAQFLDLFDTVTSIVGYASDKETFTAYVESFHSQLETYHQLYDKFKDYDGVNNIKTINDHAGIEPVVVDERILDLLEYAKEMDQATDGKMNIAMGSVLSIWYEYRTKGIADPQSAALPPISILEESSQYTDLDKVVIDREASSVYLEEKGMSLDVGAIAKGYATQKISQNLEAQGVTSMLVSVGGNVRAIGTRDDGSKWRVGIQNPDMESEEKYIQKLDLQDLSLVSSGTYQRYYTVEGKQYHHIIHPDTLMPSDDFLNVSILCKDSGMADALSTAVFNMDLEEGMAFIETLEGVEAYWVLADGTQVFSSGFEAYLVKGK